MYRNNNAGNSDVIIQLSNNLSNQIQNIRKEISDNSEKSRLEIESKLKIINKEISDFQISSKSTMQKQFADSNKIIKDVTNELAKIKTPLTLVLCDKSEDSNACGLLQLYEITKPDLLYKQYFYRSATNDTMRIDLEDVVKKTLSLIIYI